MECLEVSGAVRLIYRSLGVKGLMILPFCTTRTNYRLKKNSKLQNQVFFFWGGGGGDFTPCW